MLQPPGISPPAMPGPAQFYNIATPRAPREFKVDHRSWGDNRRPDLVAAPDAYLVWRDRALGHL